MVRHEQKISFLAKHFSCIWHKRNSIHTVKYGGGFVRLWGCLSSKCLGHLFFQDTWHHRVHDIPGDFKSGSYNLVMGGVSRIMIQNSLQNQARFKSTIHLENLWAELKDCLQESTQNRRNSLFRSGVRLLLCILQSHQLLQDTRCCYFGKGT